MDRFCTQHDFFRIGVINKTEENNSLYGIEIMCAYCAEIRKLWNDGTVELNVKFSNESPKEPNSTAS